MTDTRMQRGKEWLESLLKLTGAPANVSAIAADQIQGSEAFAEPDNYWLTIDAAQLTPEQIKILIGSEGSVLDAMQYLANAISNLNQSPEQQASYTVELDGYRIRRQAEIQAIAEDAAEQVRASGQEFEIQSLSSAERRQVHTFLKNYGDLETFSRGKEPHRHLVVRATTAKE